MLQKAKARDATRGFGFNHHSIPDAPAHDAAFAAAASEMTANQTAHRNAAEVMYEQSSVESGVLAQSVQSTLKVGATDAASEVDSSDDRMDDWRKSVDVVLSIRVDFEILD